MNIALLCYFKPNTAPFVRTLSFVEEWTKEHRLFLIKNYEDEDAIAKSGETKNLEIFYIRCLEKIRKYGCLIAFFLNTHKIIREIKKRRSDVVYITNPRLFFLAPIFDFFGIKYILEIRDYWRRKIKLSYIEYFLMKMFARRATMVVTVTSSFKEKISKELGVKDEKILLIPNGADTSRFYLEKNEKLKSELDLEDFKIVMYVGLMDYVKGLEDFVRAFKFVSKEKNVKFLLIGEGPEKNNLMKIAKEEGIDNVLFFDPVEYSMIPDYLSIADIGIVPLKPMQETNFAIPSKLFEFMAAGVPVIASATYELSKVVNESMAGLCVENPQEIASAILHLLNNEDKRKEMGENGRKYVVENYDRRKLARKLIEIMQERLAS
ncbi:MAG: glycosyltransferase family 4 protein [Candidatus Hydrothermarchaeota archaeon]